MLKPLSDAYRTAGAFALACPLLFLVPTLPELVQHVVEYRIGMFDGLASAKAVEHDDLRMIFGSIKVLALLLPGYWIARFAFGLGRARAGAWEEEGVRGYLPVLLYGVVTNMGLLWIPQWIGGRAGEVVTMTALPAQLVLGTLLARWVARAPLGEGEAGPIESIRMVGRDFPWAFLFGLVAMLPPMAIHYALNFAALGKPLPAMAALLAIDSLFVSYLVAVICLIPVAITRHAEAKAARRVRA